MNNVISTNVKYFRNVQNYKFVPKLEDEKKKEIFDTVSKAVKGRMKFVEMGDAGELDRLYKLKLIEPNSKSLFAASSDVVLSLFENEHIKINAGGLGYDNKIFDTAKAIETLIKNKIPLSFSDEYGYLVSNLALIGNGFKISSILDLSCLKEIGKIDQVIQNVKNLGYILRSVGDNLYEISTSCTLGLTEREIIEDYGKMLIKLDDLENESLKMLDVEKHDELVDLALRSHAILSTCHLLSVDELKKHLTNILRGLNLECIDEKKENVLKLYALTRTQNNISTKSDMLNLSNHVHDILKGGKNV